MLLLLTSNLKTVVYPYMNVSSWTFDSENLKRSVAKLRDSVSKQNNIMDFFKYYFR